MTQSEEALRQMLARLLPDAVVVSVSGERVTMETTAPGKAILAAEIQIRKATGIAWDLLCVAKKDGSKLARGSASIIKLAPRR